MLEASRWGLEYSRDLDEWIQCSGLKKAPEYEKMFDEWINENAEIRYTGTGYESRFYPKIEDWMNHLVSQGAKIKVGPYGEDDWDGIYEPIIFGPYTGECTVDDLYSITVFFLEMDDEICNIVIVNDEWYTNYDDGHWIWSDGYISCSHCQNNWNTDDAYTWYDNGETKRGGFHFWESERLHGWPPVYKSPAERLRIRQQSKKYARWAKIRDEYQLQNCPITDIDDVELGEWSVWRKLTLALNPKIDPNAPDKVIYMSGSGHLLHDDDGVYCPICGGKLVG